MSVFQQADVRLLVCSSVLPTIGKAGFKNVCWYESTGDTALRAPKWRAPRRGSGFSGDRYAGAFVREANLADVQAQTIRVHDWPSSIEALDLRLSEADPTFGGYEAHTFGKSSLREFGGLVCRNPVSLRRRARVVTDTPEETSGLQARGEEAAGGLSLLVILSYLRIVGKPGLAVSGSVSMRRFPYARPKLGKQAVLRRAAWRPAL